MAHTEPFCFDRSQEAELAKGFPHVRRLTDEEVDVQKVAAQRLLDTDFDLCIEWPRAVAAAMVHAWGRGQLFTMSPAERRLRLKSEVTLWNTYTPDAEQAASYLHERMTRAVPWSSDRSTESIVLLMEALLGTPVIAEAIVRELEAMGPGQLHEPATQPAWITYQLGYLLLRLDAPRAGALRERMRKVVTDGARVRPGSILQVAASPSHVRSLCLVLEGASAADRLTDRGVRWYTHATQPDAVRERVSAHLGGGTPDVRLAWLGGADLLGKPLFQRWPLLSPRDLDWYFGCLSIIRHPTVVRTISQMRAAKMKTRAKDWLIDHKDYARPILEGLGKEHHHARESLFYL